MQKNIIFIENSIFGRVMFEKMVKSLNVDLKILSAINELPELYGNNYIPEVIFVDFEEIKNKDFSGIHELNIIPEYYKTITIAMVNELSNNLSNILIKKGFDKVIEKPLTQKILKTILNDKSVEENINAEENATKDAKLYSLESVDEFAEGDESFIKQVLTVFINDTQPAVDKMNSGYRKGDLELVREAAHKYKPHVAMLNITEAIASVKNIEKFADDNVNTEEIPDLIENLNSVCKKVIEQIQADFDLD